MKIPTPKGGFLLLCELLAWFGCPHEVVWLDCFRNERTDTFTGEHLEYLVCRYIVVVVVLTVADILNDEALCMRKIGELVNSR